MFSRRALRAWAMSLASCFSESDSGGVNDFSKRSRVCGNRSEEIRVVWNSDEVRSEDISVESES